MSQNLQDQYNIWRAEMEELLADGNRGSVDCGEESVRKDFTEWAGLEKEIRFDDMLELEQHYTGFEIKEVKNEDGITYQVKTFIPDTPEIEYRQSGDSDWIETTWHSFCKNKGVESDALGR